MFTLGTDIIMYSENKVKTREFYGKYEVVSECFQQKQKPVFPHKSFREGRLVGWQYLGSYFANKKFGDQNIESRFFTLIDRVIFSNDNAAD